MMERCRFGGLILRERFQLSGISAINIKSAGSVRIPKEFGKSGSKRFFEAAVQRKPFPVSAWAAAQWS